MSRYREYGMLIAGQSLQYPGTKEARSGTSMMNQRPTGRLFLLLQPALQTKPLASGKPLEFPKR